MEIISLLIDLHLTHSNFIPLRQIMSIIFMRSWKTYSHYDWLTQKTPAVAADVLYVSMWVTVLVESNLTVILIRTTVAFRL
jgi:hypothetical protein